MRPEKLSPSWPKESYLGLSLQQPGQLKQLKMASKIMVIETLKAKSVITVNTATGQISRIAQHLKKSAINVAVRTTLKLCASPVDLSQSVTQGGQMGPIEKIGVCTDAVYMKFMKMSVMMTAQWRT